MSHFEVAVVHAKALFVDESIIAHTVVHAKALFVDESIIAPAVIHAKALFVDESIIAPADFGTGRGIAPWATARRERAIGQSSAKRLCCSSLASLPPGCGASSFSPTSFLQFTLTTNVDSTL